MKRQLPNRTTPTPYAQGKIVIMSPQKKIKPPIANCTYCYLMQEVHHQTNTLLAGAMKCLDLLLTNQVSSESRHFIAPARSVCEGCCNCASSVFRQSCKSLFTWSSLNAVLKLSTKYPSSTIMCDLTTRSPPTTTCTQKGLRKNHPLSSRY